MAYLLPDPLYPYDAETVEAVRRFPGLVVGLAAATSVDALQWRREANSLPQYNPATHAFARRFIRPLPLSLVSMES